MKPFRDYSPDVFLRPRTTHCESKGKATVVPENAIVLPQNLFHYNLVVPHEPFFRVKVIQPLPQVPLKHRHAVTADQAFGKKSPYLALGTVCSPVLITGQG